MQPFLDNIQTVVVFLWLYSQQQKPLSTKRPFSLIIPIHSTGSNTIQMRALLAFPNLANAEVRESIIIMVGRTSRSKASLLPILMLILMLTMLLECVPYWWLYADCWWWWWFVVVSLALSWRDDDDNDGEKDAKYREDNAWRVVVLDVYADMHTEVHTHTTR